MMKTYTITVNGKIYHVTVEEGIVTKAEEEKPAFKRPSLSRPSIPASVAAVKKAPALAPEAAPKAEKNETAPAAAPKKSGSVTIEAPMTGKILAVKTSVGQSVKKGEPVVILEAMKMENEIVAPEDGVIASIEVAVGQQVDTGAVLATLS